MLLNDEKTEHKINYFLQVKQTDSMMYIVFKTIFQVKSLKNNSIMISDIIGHNMDNDRFINPQLRTVIFGKKVHVIYPPTYRTTNSHVGENVVGLRCSSLQQNENGICFGARACQSLVRRARISLVRLNILSKHKHLFMITYPHHSMWYSSFCDLRIE